MGQDKLRPRRSVFSVCLQGLPREFLPIPIISKLRLSSPSPSPSPARSPNLRHRISLSRILLFYFTDALSLSLSSSNARRIAISDCCLVAAVERVTDFSKVTRRLSLNFPVFQFYFLSFLFLFKRVICHQTRETGHFDGKFEIERLRRAEATACIIRPSLPPFTTLRRRSFQILARAHPFVPPSHTPPFRCFLPRPSSPAYVYIGRCTHTDPENVSGFCIHE